MSEADTTALEIIPKESALAVLTNPEKFDEFFERVAKEVRGVEPDLTTAAGRKAVAALAFKVTKSKTAIVAAADLLTEDARAQIKKVNESKKEIETRLDDLKREVRKPLTDWEAAEEARVARVEELLKQMHDAAIVTADETATDIRKRCHDINALILDPAVCQDHLNILEAMRNKAVEALEAGHARAVRAEADAAELATLRAQTAERDRQDAERREREEQAERERIAREEEAHRAKVDRELREAFEREEQEVREREEAERAERERVAAEEAKEAARVAEEQRVERERKVAEDAAAAERKRIEDVAEAERLAQEKRAANVRHQVKIKGEAKVALISIISGMGQADAESLAVAVVRAIAAGEIPHTTITF